MSRYELSRHDIRIEPDNNRSIVKRKRSRDRSIEKQPNRDDGRPISTRSTDSRSSLPSVLEHFPVDDIRSDPKHWSSRSQRRSSSRSRSPTKKLKK